MPWKIIEHGPQIWILFQTEAEELFLDVRCQRGFTELPTLIRLSPEECLEYRALGRVAVDYLGNKVMFWPQRYEYRNVSPQFEKEEKQAVDNWKAEHPGQYL